MRLIPLMILATACTTAGGAAFEEAPVFTRYRPYTPEERSREVVACAEKARRQLEDRAESPKRSKPELRQALYEATAACMGQRGWRAS